jgi:hypothetical protein
MKKTTKPASGETVTRKRPGKAARKGQRAPRAGKAGPRPAAAAKAATPTAAGRVRKARADSKQSKLIAMLKEKGGAAVDEIAKTFGWQPHTVRGAIAGALKKRLGLDVTSEKVEGRGRVYRIGN